MLRTSACGKLFFWKKWYISHLSFSTYLPRGVGGTGADADAGTGAETLFVYRVASNIIQTTTAAGGYINTMLLHCAQSVMIQGLAAVINQS